MKYGEAAELANKSWREPTRFFHGTTHLTRMLTELGQVRNNTPPQYRSLSDKDYLMLRYFCVFHDYVYVPGSKVNEENSAQAFLALDIEDLSPDEKRRVVYMILKTKYLEGVNTDDPVERLAMDLDRSVLDDPYEKLVDWENGIYLEHRYLGNAMYKKARLAFLRKVRYCRPAIDQLIKYVKKAY